MENKPFFTIEEKKELHELYRQMSEGAKNTFKPDDNEKLRKYLSGAIEGDFLTRDIFGLNPILIDLETAYIVATEIGHMRTAILGVMLCTCTMSGFCTMEDVERDFGNDVKNIIHGMVRIQELYQKNPTIESENFRNLLISFAEDMRVILIMIANRVCIMRKIKDTDQEEARQKVSSEAAYLYAPLAHKLGLYKLKSELEDLSLKYKEHDAYYMIKDKLNATKAARDAYIEQFISPIEKKLTESGLHFHMKGRTKSIHSIWQKMKKQQCDFEGIYDLFAIRIIIDAPLDKEKQLCWQAYSIVTDMYQPNPKRLRDWLSIPKSNGYESLHITVLGPQKKWVEIQIRTERMDDVAEHGLAAHWRYKGIQGSDTGVEDWLNSIRSALENNDDMQLMDQFKTDLYEDEVYVFTPKGDLFKLPKGATVLDFAYHIHSNVGNHCIGAKVNERNVSMRQTLVSGDSVEVLTSTNQTPKQDWLNIVTTSRAKSKIRQALKEVLVHQGAYGKEILERKFRNRKIEYEETTMGHLVKKLGYKNVTDFYRDVAEGKVEINDIIDSYSSLQKHENQGPEPIPTVSAENFNLKTDTTLQSNSSEDVLVIDKNLKGLDYTLARCCHPVYGDDVFGFVTVNGGIKIHRQDCSNAAEMKRRFGYRIVKARWSGKGNNLYPITLHVIGNDDIGIVSNITSIISKEEHITLRSISIDSNDGLFAGILTVMVDDKTRLTTLLKKLRTVKGVKQVLRN
jgi:guanosine-3',5'-bis(diphosphate) 3'-pyrophosphohydrolase